jgi:hypothetical protein
MIAAAAVGGTTIDITGVDTPPPPPPSPPFDMPCSTTAGRARAQNQGSGISSI